MSQLVIGIDVGGTKIAGALVAADGRLVAATTKRTPRGPSGADPGAFATADLLTGLLARPEARGARIGAAAIGVPEYVDPAGRITSSLVLDWGIDSSADVPAALAQAANDTALVIGSDVRFAAFAESRIGRGRGVASFLYVTVGTGVSHALVIDGAVWTGHRGEAIALGELTVCDPLRPDAPATVESQASGRALEHVAAGFDVAPDDSSDLRLEQARRHAGRVVATAIASAVSLVDPELVVLGGGLGAGNSAFSDELALHYRSCMSTRPRPPALRRAALGPSAGVVGAGLAAHDHRASP